jgi:hypothetical protein
MEIEDWPTSIQENTECIIELPTWEHISTKYNLSSIHMQNEDTCSESNLSWNCMEEESSSPGSNLHATEVYGAIPNPIGDALTIKVCGDLRVARQSALSMANLEKLNQKCSAPRSTIFLQFESIPGNLATFMKLHMATCASLTWVEPIGKLYCCGTFEKGVSVELVFASDTRVGSLLAAAACLDPCITRGNVKSWIVDILQDKNNCVSSWIKRVDIEAIGR